MACFGLVAVGLKGGGFGGERRGIERVYSESKEGEDGGLELHGGFGFWRLRSLGGVWVEVCLGVRKDKNGVAGEEFWGRFW